MNHLMVQDCEEDTVVLNGIHLQKESPDLIGLKIQDNEDNTVVLKKLDP